MKNIISLLALVVTISATALPHPPTPKPPKCKNPTKRISWHDLNPADKKAYIAAEQCIMRADAKLNTMPGAKTRWDELVGLHQVLSLQIHSTGTFLPYHRYMLHAHEYLLNECGYKKGLPYWDETRDAGNFAASPLLDPVLGFGGSGQGSANCVPNGPFQNFTINIGPGFTSSPRCVNRKINDAFSGLCSAADVKKATSASTYEEAWVAMYNGPHLFGHIALAMMDGDSITSNGDPLFFMHHGFVDKMWADWQAKDRKRLKEINGLNAQDPAVGFLEFEGDMEEESKMWGHPTAAIKAVTPDPTKGDKGGNQTTLGHILTTLGIIPDTPLESVMDIRGGYLCYEYV